MANSRRTTNLGPILSLTTNRSDSRAPHLFLDSNTTLTASGPVIMGSTLSLTGATSVGALTAAGAVIGESTLSMVGASSVGALTSTGAATFSGNANVTGSFAVGSGTSIARIQKSTVSVSLGQVNAQESVATTGTINALTSDAAIFYIQPASIWSGDYYQVNLAARASAASTFQIYASNVSGANITPDAMNMDLWWIDPS